jgi:hypothetical protein
MYDNKQKIRALEDFLQFIKIDEETRGFRPRITKHW